MKNNHFILTLCCLIIGTTLFAQATTSASLREQLTAVNAEWAKQDAQIANSPALVFADDDALIQAHLRIVEQTLRSKSTAALTQAQAAARSNNLDELHRYWQQKRFPRNTNHTARTPYFIDKYGTACAVGQLIIASGVADFAQKIHTENNYAYIADLVETYPQLPEWANNNGFSVAELAWIQPTYSGCPYAGCSAGQVRPPSCVGSYNGCIGFPVIPASDTSFYFPVVYNFWRKSGTDWSWADPQSANGCLSEGEYKWTLTDVNGTVYNTPSIILAVQSEPTLSIAKTDVNGACTGTATATVIGTSTSYNHSYYWYPTQQTGLIATNLCAGTHYIIVSYNDACNGSTVNNIVQHFQIENLTTTTNVTDENTIRISPNPAHAQIYIAQQNATQGTAVFSDICGRDVKTMSFQTNNTLDVSDLPKGVYFIQFKTAESAHTQRLVIE